VAHPNAEFAMKASDALASGDMEAFLGLHSEDVVIHIPGRGPGTGDFRGRDGVTEAFQQLAGILDGPPGWEVHDILATDDHAVVLGTQTFRRGGKTLDDRQAVVLHISNGHATEVWVHPSDQYAIDEFLA
jgi:uncharacterized protein